MCKNADVFLYKAEKLRFLLRLWPYLVEYTKEKRHHFPIPAKIR